MKACALALVVLVSGCYRPYTAVTVRTEVSPAAAYLAMLHTLRSEGYEDVFVDEQARCARVGAKHKASRWRAASVTSHKVTVQTNEIELCVDERSMVRARARGSDVLAWNGQSRMYTGLQDEIDGLVRSVLATSSSEGAPQGGAP